jgi:hypothetical protein
VQRHGPHVLEEVGGNLRRGGRIMHAGAALMVILLDGAWDAARHGIVAHLGSVHPSRLNAGSGVRLSPFLARARNRVHAQPRQQCPRAPETLIANGKYQIVMGVLR